MASLFTKIIKGEIPCYKVAENADFLAFFDINPNAKGHTLVIPKKEVNKLFELDEPTYLGLMAFARKVAIALEKVVACERIGVSVIGLEVPHVHVHLIPLHTLNDIDFKHKVCLTPEEFSDLAKKVSAVFEA
jgi:histidine triad (HIT) family protein